MEGLPSSLSLSLFEVVVVTDEVVMVTDKVVVVIDEDMVKWCNGVVDESCEIKIKGLYYVWLTTVVCLSWFSAGLIMLAS